MRGTKRKRALHLRTVPPYHLFYSASSQSHSSISRSLQAFRSKTARFHGPTQKSTTVLQPMESNAQKVSLKNFSEPQIQMLEPSYTA